MPRRDRAQQGPFGLAARHGLRTARMEGAAGRRIQRRRQLALDRPVGAPARRQRRQLLEQRLRVRMIGALEDLVGGRQLDHAAQVHDGHAVRDVADHAEVVADEQVRQVQLAAQPLEQVQHLRLDRHVQRRHRLVADDDGGLERQRARDANALALAARELVRITLRIAWVQPDLAHQPGHVIGLVARGHQLVRHRRLADDLAHPHARVQRGIGILEDHLHAQLVGAPFRARQALHRLAAIAQLARAGRQDARDDAAQRGLAAARLAHDANDLARHHIQVHAGHRVHDLRLQARAQQVGDAAGQVHRLHEAQLDAAQRQDGRRSVMRHRALPRASSAPIGRDGFPAAGARPDRRRSRAGSGPGTRSLAAG